jgi:3-oxoacyl-[acyl-carrier-protein] synthase-3
MIARLRATGSYLPEKEVLNQDLTQFPASARPLIQQKTGIVARRHAGKGECTSDLAAQAARVCLADAGLPAGDVQGIILATSSPDRMQPATATRVQHLLGATGAFAFDVNSVCSGGVYALEVGNAFIQAGIVRNILVIASDVYSKILNPADFSTYPYFGDGAGAVLLQSHEDSHQGSPGIIKTILRTDGAGHDVIQVPCGGTMKPYALMQSPREQYFTMKGKEVYDFAATRAPEIIRELMEAAGLTPDCVAWVIPHQANLNIIRDIAAAVGIPQQRFITNLDKYGNTAGASVLIALDQLCRSGAILPGQVAILVAFGGGLSWAASAIRF